MGGRGVTASSPTSPTRVQARERDLLALGLRARGSTFADIGRALGVSKQSAHAAVQRGLDLRTQEIRERADDLRAVESARLDAAAEALWEQVEAGDARAHDTWLRNRARYAALLGLDARPPDVDDVGPVFHVIDARLPHLRGDAIGGASREISQIGDGS